MSDPRKPLAEEAVDETELELHDEDAGTGEQSSGGSDADVDDAGDDEPTDGVEDLGDADEPSDDDGSQAAVADGRRTGEEGKPVSRAQRRFQELSNRTRAAEERAAEAERRAAQALAAAEERRSAAQREEEAERLRLMDPAERAEYRATKLEERFGQELGRLQFQQQDVSDRTSFDGLLARRPEFERFRDQVERQLEVERRNGINMPRQTVLWTLIGKSAYEKAPAARTRAAKKGAENIARQTARPVRAGGDVQRGNERSGSESQKLRNRLKDMQI